MDTVTAGRDYTKVVRACFVPLEYGRKLRSGYSHELGCSNGGLHLGNHSLCPSSRAHSPSVTAFTAPPSHGDSTLRFTSAVSGHFPQATEFTRERNVKRIDLPRIKSLSMNRLSSNK